MDDYEDFDERNLGLPDENDDHTREVLDMGGTSKAGNDELAGTHGEGFKLAALLMI
ncbi:predicted protein [Botrytis cinerea T4]|uniref:Uncharacterized protein n=1 Tax=Botryotinia fuckeliana (strain T4) TaxID=999810 RepID=G2YV82_BOTF4|nr:predicted protein [Botrytis cinerea T4]